MNPITVARNLPERQRQGMAIFASHGIADGLTTIAAAEVFGVGVEANPFVRDLLEIGNLYCFVGICAVVGLVAAEWPRLSELANLPAWAAYVLASIGLLVAASNLIIAIGGL